MASWFSERSIAIGHVLVHADPQEPPALGRVGVGTEDDDRDRARRLRAAGASDVLAEPVDADAVLDAVCGGLVN